jgi:hypothetical protein
MKLDFSVRFLPVHAVRCRPGKCATCAGFSVRHAPDYANIGYWANEVVGNF